MQPNPHFTTSRAEVAAHGSDAMRLARRLTATLLAVMGIQAVIGLVFQTAYRDIDWIRATWFGNDWVTLVVAVPLLFAGLVRGAAGSIRGLLLWLGLIAYALYNYVFYLFGAALNPFFPILCRCARVVSDRADPRCIAHRCATSGREFSSNDPSATHRRLSRLRRTRVGVRMDANVGRIHLRGPANAR